MKKKLNIIVFILLVILPLPLYSKIVINEIAWMGTTNSANHEWLELYNASDDEVDLTGWVLAARDGTPTINLSGAISANGYFLLERTSDLTLPDINADQIYTGALGNSGEFLELKDSDGNLMDQVDASAGWPAGDNNTKQTMSRISPETAEWKNSALTGGTPRGPNDFEIIIEPDPTLPPPETLPATEEEISKTPSGSKIKIGDIVINEFVADPAEGDEWIELYNKTGNETDLTGWRIEEGSKAKTKITGIILGNGFLVIEKPKGNLNNKGDIIILKNESGKIIDQVTYGNWQDDDLSDNAPAATKSNSVARIYDGFDTDNDFNDFKITSFPTKGATNIIIEPEDFDDRPAAEKIKYSQSIIINEIYPNPPGIDKEEFIEIKNIGNSETDLNGWRLGDASTKRFNIRDTKIKGGEIIVFYKEQTGIALNNSGREKVTLYWPNKEIADEITYEGTVPEGKSYARDDNGFWYWSIAITPGSENIIEKKNEPPYAVINAPAWARPGEIIDFDGSDSTDPENQQLKYLWDFGDGQKDQRILARKVYPAAGKYQVVLKVIDEQLASSTAKLIIFISEEKEVLDPDQEAKQINDGQKMGAINQFGFNFISIYISEFLPNPVGDDVVGEFIELYNPNNFLVNLTGWKLDDIEGGSKPFVFSESYIILPNSYLTLYRYETKIALNNNNDAVRLFDNYGNIVSEVYYDKTYEGVSFIRMEDGSYEMTKTPTPNEINVLNAVIPGKTGAFEEFFKIADAKDCETNSSVVVSGTVLVEPGILGSQIFYISDESGGIQVYMYKKDWPNLKSGNEVRIAGITSQSRGEARVKIANKEDIEIIKKGAPPISQSIKIADIANDLDGALVTVSGEVTESKSYGFYIDDGTDELYSYIKQTSGVKKDFKVGDTVTVTGILTNSESGLRLLPRYQSDIKKTKVLGADAAMAENDNLKNPTTESDGYNRYLIAAIIALAAIIFNLIFRIKKLNKKIISQA